MSGTKNFDEEIKGEQQALDALLLKKQEFLASIGAVGPIDLAQRWFVVRQHHAGGLLQELERQEKATNDRLALLKLQAESFEPPKKKSKTPSERKKPSVTLPDLPGIETLTDRQQDVMSFKAAGWSDSQIAEQLGLDRKTVYEHYQAGSKKLRDYRENHSPKHRDGKDEEELMMEMIEARDRET